MTRRKSLEIAPGFRLPLDAVTETFAWLATRGGGKTYGAGVFVEELLKAEEQVVVIDPMPAWWGLRTSADGKSDGFPIAILGGDHGDVPLEETAGSLVAELVVRERLSAVLDVSGFSKSARRRFVTDFAETLYQRNREAMHLVVEEADMFAPQKAHGEERMLGAFEDLVRRGRGRGIGTTLITQRAAVISKNVLDLTENLVVLRTLGTRSRAPIKDWIEDHGTAEERDAVMHSLQKLKAGEAWFYSPHFLGKLERIQIRPKITFDSSATPKPGERRRVPKTVADVDLEALSVAMAETIERKKSEDPTELQRRIRSLEQDLESARGYVEDAEKALLRREEERAVTIEIPVIPDAIGHEHGALQAAAKNVISGAETIAQIMQRLGAQMYELESERERKLRDLHEAGLEITAGASARGGHTLGTVTVPKTAKPQVDGGIRGDSKGDNKARDRAAMNGHELTDNESRILGALLQIPTGMNGKRLSIVTGLRGGSLNAALAKLRANALVSGKSGEIDIGEAFR